MKAQSLLLTLLFITCCKVAVFSQSGESKIDYQKGDKIAAVLEMPYPAEIVEDAIKDYMAKKGAKNDRYKSFAIFRSARLPEINEELCDVHFKVERKVQKDRETSIIYALIGRPGENMSVRASDDRFKIPEAKELLNKIAPLIDSYKLELDIKKQEEVVKKSEKKLLSLKDDQYDLEKKLKTLQEKLAQNKNDQLLQNDELLRQKDLLSTIMNKKK